MSVEFPAVGHEAKRCLTPWLQLRTALGSVLFLCVCVCVSCDAPTSTETHTRMHALFFLH